MTSIPPMSHSKRIRICLGDRTYEQLVHLADLADNPVTIEARLLLTWGIDLALRRWEELSAAYGDDGEKTNAPAGWAQPTLPMIEPSADETAEALAEMRQNPRIVRTDDDDISAPRPYPPTATA